MRIACLCYPGIARWFAEDRISSNDRASVGSSTGKAGSNWIGG